MPGIPADSAAVGPAAAVSGQVFVPGDKSISHRYAVLAALADGPSLVRNYSPGADCAATLACLEALGVRIERPAPAVLRIEGRGFDGLRQPERTLDAANSGTTLRLLAGVAAGRPFVSVLDGDSSLARRPMRRVTEPLARMGASITSRDGRPPLTIEGAALRGITHQPEVPSAQVKSAVLLAGLQASGRTTIVEPSPTRDHTERALAAFGVTVGREAGSITVEGGQALRACAVTVPGDISSAAFWIALAAAAPGSDLRIEGIGLNPTRTGVIDVARRAGADIALEVETEVNGEPVGWIRVRGNALRGFSIEPDEVPAVIDEIPALAALAARLPDGERMHVSGASELRVKESDRIACLAAGLRALGASIDEHPDGFEIVARRLTGGTADACGDHRLAMAFAVAAAGARQPSTILGASSVAVSYPGFFDELARLASTR